MRSHYSFHRIFPTKTDSNSSNLLKNYENSVYTPYVGDVGGLRIAHITVFFLRLKEKEISGTVVRVASGIEGKGGAADWLRNVLLLPSLALIWSKFLILRETERYLAAGETRLTPSIYTTSTVTSHPPGTDRCLVEERLIISTPCDRIVNAL